MTNDGLFESYRQTTYSAETPLGEIHLRVGEPNGELVQLLRRYKANSWAYITAFNPGSQPLAHDENLRRQKELVDSLHREGLTFFSGAGAGDDSQWPPEDSVLVLSISRSRAIQLAREFGQNAILFGGADAVPELLDCQ